MPGFPDSKCRDVPEKLIICSLLHSLPIPLTMRSFPAPLRRLTYTHLLSRTLLNQTRLHSSLSRQSFAPRSYLPPRSSLTPARRCESSLAIPGEQPRDKDQQVRDDEPAYELTFTCKPCLYRSSHKVTKHGYHKGTVLITCPSCKARHVIADHLKVFLDRSHTLEDILRQKAAQGVDFTKYLKKGQLGIRPGSLVGNQGEEDLEFWEDGTESVHTPVDGKDDTQGGSSKP